MKIRFDVVRIDTGEVVKSIDCTGKSEREREAIERGLIRQTDTERFFVREVIS